MRCAGIEGKDSRFLIQEYELMRGNGYCLSDRESLIV